MNRSDPRPSDDPTAFAPALCSRTDGCIDCKLPAQQRASGSVSFPNKQNATDIVAANFNKRQQITRSRVRAKSKSTGTCGMHAELGTRLERSSGGGKLHQAALFGSSLKQSPSGRQTTIVKVREWSGEASETLPPRLATSVRVCRRHSHDALASRNGPSSLVRSSNEGKKKTLTSGQVIQFQKLTLPRTSACACWISLAWRGRRAIDYIRCIPLRCFGYAVEAEPFRLGSVRVYYWGRRQESP